MSIRNYRRSCLYIFLALLPAICGSRTVSITAPRLPASSTVAPSPSPTRLQDRLDYLQDRFDYLCMTEYTWNQAQACFVLCQGVVCLPTSPTPPDPLGISLVSGFYGPGAWSGWVLSLVASYARLYNDPYAKLDPNTWLFLLGTNWASVDFLRQIQGSARSSHAPAEKDKRAGTFAASLTVIYWGCWYVLVQLLVILCIQEEKAPPFTQRSVTLLSGSLLPTTSLTVALFSTIFSDPANSMGIGGVPLNNMPFLYFWGSPAPSVYALSAFAIGSLMLACTLVALTMIVIRTCLYDWYKWARTWDLRGRKYLPGFLALLFFIAFFPLVCFGIAMVTNATAYFFMGYKDTWSKSCFYMPCAPQSLLDWDQLYSLVVGLILLFGIEIVPAFMKSRKEKYDFEDNLRERMAQRLNRRRARAAVRQSVDIACLTNIGTEGDDIELGSLNPDEDEEEPDATLDFDVLERVLLYETFAASEDAIEQSGFVKETDD
ncbi:hypothetical protein BDV96DRAFT_288073 [Lophiotrema nucula]|uniref:Transmembrane protein n=1 Tax=Lophiotrema nucula TaxID=690887 RepID=A0A6A5YLH6_9PLEO|nr:hypothetical protein BDV96DRAFT_288073 [Lophiotrema nucula]